MAIQNLTGIDTFSNLVSKFNENFEEVYLKSGPELTYSSENETVTVKNLASNGTIKNGNLTIFNNGSIMHSGSITLYPGGMTSNGISIVADQTNKEFSYIIPSSEGVHGYVGTTNYYFSSMHSDAYAFNSGIYLRYDDNNSQIAVIEPGLYTSGAGVNVRFGANQTTMITAGEGCLGVVDDTTYNGGENVILAADSAVEFIVGANTYANHKAVYISVESLSPRVTNTMTLGTSARRWTSVYGTTIYTDKIEFGNNDNIVYSDTSNLFSFIADGSVNSSFLQCGQLSVKPANASSGFGVRYLSGTNDVCVIPLRDLMHQTNGKGNVGTGSCKWDYVQANHVTGTSDIEIKENMTQFDESYAYESIRNIPIYNYQMVDRENTYYVGTTTQEMPVEMVHLFDGGKGSEYLPNSSIWFLYGAFKEAQRKIEALEQEVVKLGGTI